MKNCTICKHKIEHHYLKPNGKIYWWWGKNKFGQKRRYCACKECEEWDAMYG